MKQFFMTLPKNVIGCFRGRMIGWHLAAALLTFILVRSGFDWAYYRATRDPGLRAWMFPAAPIGGLVPMVLPLMLIAGGIIVRSAATLRTGWAVGQAGLIGLLISSACKAVTGRAHPVRGAGGVDITHVFHFGFLRGGMFWGWPSSHTTIAFAMAAAIWTLFPQKKWLGCVALAYALYIGLGVSMTIHWFSDFAAGMMIGTVVGVVVGRSFAPRTDTDQPG
jgi:membrane-associated phospholipid phosphatase